MLRSIGLVCVAFPLMLLPLVGCLTAQRMETRIYRVDDVFWRSISAPDSPYHESDDISLASDLRDFLVRAGVEFGPDSLVILNRKDNLVTLRNHSPSLDRVEQIMGPMAGNGSFYSERLK
jgi:hypothetical protein